MYTCIYIYKNSAALTFSAQAVVSQIKEYKIPIHNIPDSLRVNILKPRSCWAQQLQLFRHTGTTVTTPIKFLGLPPRTATRHTE